MSSSLPDGFSVRPPTLADAETVAAVIGAEERAFRAEAQWGAEDVRDWWSHLDLQRNAWLVEADGQAVATGAVMKRGNGLDGWMSVRPDYAGRGISTALIRMAEELGRELGVPIIRLGTLAENLAGQDLLESSGYRDVRHYYEMRIDLDLPPPEPKWPPGLTVATFDLADARRLHAAINEAFADEWNFRVRSFEEWSAHRLEAPNFDPTLWFVAKDGDEIAAFILCWAKQYGGPYVGLVGVRSPWRRRGLRLALLQQAFGEFYRRGERRVELGVDAGNQTGATRLYERAGMYVHHEDIVYEKSLV